MGREQAQREVSQPARARDGSLEPTQSGPEPDGSLPVQAQFLLSLQQTAGNRAVSGLAQGRVAPAQSENADKEETLPRRNQTGLPDGLKSGIESLSGISLDDVRVHYSSTQPAQLGALAYAQGNEIHVAPGQERHLSHEAWHVVQQAQGRVPATAQLQEGVPINDDDVLEHEADSMGATALANAAQLQRAPQGRRTWHAQGPLRRNVVQRVLDCASPIVAADVRNVKRAGGNPVWILSGNGEVVIKVESPGAGELGPDFSAREKLTSELAQVALANAPDTNPTSQPDRNALMALDPTAVAGDVAGLQGVLTQVAGGQIRGAIVLKKQKVDVGMSLEKLMKAARGESKSAFINAGAGGGGRAKLKAGDPKAQITVRNILSDPGICSSFGRIAAFDLVVNNFDRFIHDGTVNLANLDLTPAIAPHLPTVLPLDNLSVQFPLTASEWKGRTHLVSAAAMTAYATSVVAYLFKQAGIDDVNQAPLVVAFANGMVAAALLLKGQEATFRQRANAWVGDPAEKKIAAILTHRLHQLP